MKKKTTKLMTLLLCASLFVGLLPSAGCSKDKEKLSGTALAEALLSQERINHEHLNQSFDFLDNRLEEEATPRKEQSPQARTRFSKNKTKAYASKGEIISGSGDTAVYSWSNFDQLVTELYYFQSHFSAGQARTKQVDENISFLENKADIKDKWVKGISYIDYLMQVEENREIIYANDTENGNYSVGIRTVNDEINTTYESYENQKETTIRTLATPNRRYEYTTIAGDQVTAFVADNDNGYWRFTQMYSWKGDSLSLSVLIMTDDFAYSFRYHISAGSMYSSEITLLSPDLQYEIAKLNGSEITIFPGSFTGINSLQVSQEEQTALGEYGTWIGYTDDYGYYSTYAAPHIHTNKGVLAAPVPIPAAGGGKTTTPTVLDEKVSYVNGSVGGLWETVYPKLVFDVQGEDVTERFNNLHTALAKYGIESLYNKDEVGQMAADMLKFVDGYNAHYTWNGEVLSSYENAMNAYAAEKAKMSKYETLFAEAKKLPTATKNDFLEMEQNAGFPALSFAAETAVSVEKGKITLNDLSATVKSDAVLEKNKNYVLKLALKKNTDTLEELLVLDNKSQDVTTTYVDGDLTLTLSGQFDLPADISEGEYDVVAYAATADSGIRVSKFQRVLCVGEVNDTLTLENFKVQTVITPDKILRSTYEKLFDVAITLAGGTAYSYEQVLTEMENEVMDKGYFLTGAKIEAYDPETQTATVVESETLSAGVYRLAYLGKADGGKVTAYIYCEIE